MVLAAARQPQQRHDATTSMWWRLSSVIEGDDHMAAGLAWLHMPIDGMQLGMQVP
jgi:hypothetical protein